MDYYDEHEQPAYEEYERYDDGDAFDAPRNARPRGQGWGRYFAPRHPMHQHPPMGGIRPRPHSQPTIIREPIGPHRPWPVHHDAGEYLTIKKSLIAEVIPAFGQLWASLLGRPEAPRAVGNDITDRDNAAMHREALALHQQNQTRILAISDLVARAARLFLQ